MICGMDDEDVNMNDEDAKSLFYRFLHTNDCAMLSFVVGYYKCTIDNLESLGFVENLMTPDKFEVKQPPLDYVIASIKKSANDDNDCKQLISCKEMFNIILNVGFTKSNININEYKNEISETSSEKTNS